MQRERPHLMILTGDLNCRSSHWWPQDAEEPEGMALEELIETNNLHQLIDEPTNIRGEAMSCIDLIITDQPNLFLQSGVHSSLDQNCQHQIIYGKINISLPSPPPYKRTVWEYDKASVAKIKAVLNAVDWKTMFCGFGSDDMADIFTNITYSILSENIPNKIIKYNDKDPPWINNELKTAIKRKHRVFKKFLDRGRRQEDWNLVKEVRNETSKVITRQKKNITRNWVTNCPILTKVQKLIGQF